MKKIAIFASGSGTNAENIIKHFTKNANITVCRIFCNNPSAKVIQRAENFNIPCTVFNKNEFNDPSEILRILKQDNTDLIVLAGFLWLFPVHILKDYPNKIINIHPALLPKFGGKGMYGSRVHEAVISAKEAFSGITIHYVNEFYDEGEIIFQAKCKVEKDDSPESLAKKVHALEYAHFPTVIQNIVENINTN
ncbi:MAG: phosphoribosylglycinamide formyltransferase [Bacteroidales bacterium]|nr:phosphoribosylglycinamide formyltransferase [Bacteroidales bacterium]MCF8404952.1 phosphoribosylglycinamide formyltransferase [Bacteroidales bacterium]